MSDDPSMRSLRAVLRLRRLAVDDARRGLAARIAALGTADGAVRETQERITRERSRPADPHTLEVAAAWFHRQRHRLTQALSARDAADAASNDARAGLGTVLADLSTAETLEAEREAERRGGFERREQRALDDRRHNQI